MSFSSMWKHIRTEISNHIPVIDVNFEIHNKKKKEKNTTKNLTHHNQNMPSPEYNRDM